MPKKVVKRGREVEKLITGSHHKKLKMNTISRKMFLGSRARTVRTADNFAAICEPIV
jgi:hypothetical protein